MFKIYIKVQFSNHKNKFRNQATNSHASYGAKITKNDPKYTSTRHAPKAHAKYLDTGYLKGGQQQG